MTDFHNLLQLFNQYIVFYFSPTTSRASVESRASVKSRAAISSGQITKRISSCTQPLPSTPPPTSLVKRKENQRSKYVLLTEFTPDQTTYCMVNILVSKVNLKQTLPIIFYSTLAGDMKFGQKLPRPVPLWQIIAIHISTSVCHHTIWGCTDNTNKNHEQLNAWNKPYKMNTWLAPW